MLETPHVAVGAAIAMKIPNPIIALPLCLASHFILDRVPHWNPHTYTETEKYGYPTKNTFAIASVDVTIALVVGMAVAYQALPNVNQALLVLACSFISVLPDVSKYPYFLIKSARKGLLKKWVDMERAFQVDTTFVPGLLTQLVTVLAAFWWMAN